MEPRKWFVWWMLAEVSLNASTLAARRPEAGGDRGNLPEAERTTLQAVTEYFCNRISRRGARHNIFL